MERGHLTGFGLTAEYKEAILEAIDNPHNKCMGPQAEELFIGGTTDALMLLQCLMVSALTRPSFWKHGGRFGEAEQKRFIKSGNVFVYDEHSTGIKRWTDRRNWSPSRIAGNFLLYRELRDKLPRDEGKERKKLDRQNGPGNNRSKQTCISDERRYLVGALDNVDGHEAYPYTDDDGLMKKTLSVDMWGRRFRLVSYYSVNDVMAGRLCRPLQNEVLREVILSPILLTLPWTEGKKLPHSLIEEITSTPQELDYITSNNGARALQNLAQGDHEVVFQGWGRVQWHPEPQAANVPARHMSLPYSYPNLMQPQAVHIHHPQVDNSMLASLGRYQTEVQRIQQRHNSDSHLWVNDNILPRPMDQHQQQPQQQQQHAVQQYPAPYLHAQARSSQSYHPNTLPALQQQQHQSQQYQHQNQQYDAHDYAVLTPEDTPPELLYDSAGSGNTSYNTTPSPLLRDNATVAASNNAHHNPPYHSLDFYRGFLDNSDHPSHTTTTTYASHPLRQPQPEPQQLHMHIHIDPLPSQSYHENPTFADAWQQQHQQQPQPQPQPQHPVHRLGRLLGDEEDAPADADLYEGM